MSLTIDNWLKRAEHAVSADDILSLLGDFLEPRDDAEYARIVTSYAATFEKDAGRRATTTELNRVAEQLRSWKKQPVAVRLLLCLNALRSQQR